MNRAIYYDYIEARIETLASRIITRGKLNILDLNIHSETFFQDLYNRVFDYKLVNMNLYEQNFEGIDLVDEGNKLVAQVSATITKQKIESSLKKDKLARFTGYQYQFISIARDASNLKSNTFKNPHNLVFNPEKDIIDKLTILKKVFNMPTDEMKSLYEFIKKELGTGYDEEKTEEPSVEIRNENSPDSINIIGNGNTVNKLDLKQPKFSIKQISRSEPQGDLFKSEFLLTITTPVPVPNVYLKVSASTLQSMDANAQRTGMIMIGHSGKRDGYAFTNLSNAYGDYKIIVDTKINEPIGIVCCIDNRCVEWQFKEI